MHPGKLIMDINIVYNDISNNFNPIIKLYNSIIKLFSILGENIKKILGFSHFCDSRFGRVV